jgi:predicted secreted protein
MIMLFCSVLTVSLYAGDVASFVNLGFSSDGTRFVFGQYGITDSDFRSYADIYCVDVVKNTFIPNGRFATAPSAETAEKDGRGVFAALQNSAASFIGKLDVDSAIQGRALYVLAENGDSMKDIAFRDFETGTSYSIKLNSLVEGKGDAVKSSFYLSVEMTDKGGKVTKKTVGQPGFKRDGVQSYRIRRIITDATGKSLVFIIEKEMYDLKGISVRFMVEALRL